DWSSDVCSSDLADGAELLEKLPDTPVDVVLCDIRMPGMDGIEVARRLSKTDESPPMLLLTTFDDPELLMQAAQAGARGFLLKDAAPEDLRDAIVALAQGDTLLQPVSTDPIRARYRYHADDAPKELFSEREVAVLRLLAGGYSNK